MLPVDLKRRIVEALPEMSDALGGVVDYKTVIIILKKFLDSKLPNSLSNNRKAIAIELAVFIREKMPTGSVVY